MLIALDRRNASRTASSSDGYGFILVPPIAGPSTVEWTPTSIQVPVGSSKSEDELLTVPPLQAFLEHAGILGRRLADGALNPPGRAGR